MMMKHDDDDFASDPGPADPSGAVDLGSLAATLGFALRRAQAAVGQDFARCFAAETIRPTQFAVLQLLRSNPGLRQSQVSFALGIKRTNFVPLFDELERRGLAERRQVPGDRRASALFLSAEGAATLERLQEIARGHEARFTARLEPANRAVLMGLLHRLADRSFDPEQ